MKKITVNNMVIVLLIFLGIGVTGAIEQKTRFPAFSILFGWVLCEIRHYHKELPQEPSRTFGKIIFAIWITLNYLFITYHL